MRIIPLGDEHRWSILFGTWDDNIEYDIGFKIIISEEII